MTKREFIKKIEIIEGFIEEQERYAKIINSLLTDGSGIFTFGSNIIEEWIKDISKMSKINIEAIEWYLYEKPFANSKNQDRTCKYDDGFEMNVLTPSDLWDFEKHKVKK